MKIELEDLLSNYVLSDGQIISFKTNLNYLERSKSTATVKLTIRKLAGRKKLEKCIVKMHFEQVIEASINEDLGSDYYSDVVLIKQENGSYYLSLDPYENTSKPHEEDNLVIIANTISIEVIE